VRYGNSLGSLAGSVDGQYWDVAFVAFPFWSEVFARVGGIKMAAAAIPAAGWRLEPPPGPRAVLPVCQILATHLTHVLRFFAPSQKFEFDANSVSRFALCEGRVMDVCRSFYLASKQDDFAETAPEASVDCSGIAYNGRE
jgi:hypothetical protein